MRLFLVWKVDWQRHSWIFPAGPRSEFDARHGFGAKDGAFWGLLQVGTQTLEVNEAVIFNFFHRDASATAAALADGIRNACLEAL